MAAPDPTSTSTSTAAPAPAATATATRIPIPISLPISIPISVPIPAWSAFLPLLLLAAALLLPASAAAQRCADEEGGAGVPPTEMAPVDPRSLAGARRALQALVDDALRRSEAVGAAALLASAAADEVEATRAEGRPQAALNGSVGPAGNRYEGRTTSAGWQARAGIDVGALLYDGGRLEARTDWRRRLAEAARESGVQAREQVALQTVSLAIERSRYRQQLDVNEQYRRKMSCLVDALQRIVDADRGRGSELVQARKNEQQADLLVQQSRTALRQTEIRLQRFVSPALAASSAGEEIAPLLATPAQAEIQAEAEAAADLAALALQAEAERSLARALRAEDAPRVGWTIGGAQTAGAGRSTAWSAGVTLTVPLLAPGVQPAADAAVKRAQAARLQYDDALRQRRAQIAETHEQASSAFDRARIGAGVVRDSDRLRRFTLQQWQQLGRRSLFDVMSAESDHYAQRVAYVNALHDGQQSNALLRSLGRGLTDWLQRDPLPTP